MSAILDWFGGIWAKVAMVGGIILAGLLAILMIERKGEKAGAQSVEIKAAKATADAVQKAQDVQRTLDGTPDEEVSKELLKKWSRP